jgi:hypothetical protein
MIVIKKRKLNFLVGGTNPGRMTLDVLKIFRLPYNLTFIPDEDNILEFAVKQAQNLNWDPDTTLCVWTNKSPAPYPRVSLFIKDMTVERLISATDRVAKLKAFI